MTSEGSEHLCLQLWRHCLTWLTTWILSCWPASVWHGAAQGKPTTTSTTSSSFSKRCRASSLCRVVWPDTTPSIRLYYSKAWPRSSHTWKTSKTNRFQARQKVFPSLLLAPVSLGPAPTTHRTKQDRAEIYRLQAVAHSQYDRQEA